MDKPPNSLNCRLFWDLTTLWPSMRPKKPLRAAEPAKAL